MATSSMQTRRKVLKSLGLTIASIPILGLVACNSSKNETNIANVETTSSDTTTLPDTTSSSETGNWLVGTTDLITDNFPEDTLFETTTACTIALTGSTTEGPCYFAAESSNDISTGISGLPMMLCLQLIDSNCNPLAGYEISVWHCDTQGVYSADTSDSADSSRFAGNFCTGGNKEAEKSTWFRGELITDSNGRVNFKSCFPGWYSGRTIHIHFRVKNNNSDSVISQFCFTDQLTEDICTTHSEYSARGTQDTPLSGGRDTVFGSSYDEFQFNTQQNSDGSLLAYKTIQIN
ncbi:MAG: intradiol ring-cleavage dioxygenase [Colwellia sp.]|nr:intradiol ring-cleavage dioxygenase [Colwellia sp.]